MEMIRTHMNRALALLIVVLACAASGAGQSTQVIVVKAGRLFDGRTDHLLSNEIVVVKGDRIEDVGPVGVELHARRHVVGHRDVGDQPVVQRVRLAPGTGRGMQIVLADPARSFSTGERITPAEQNFGDLVKSVRAWEAAGAP